MSFPKEEIERYSRQIVLRGVGGPGQNKLKAAGALAVGAGGLGSPALQYLAGAGVGRLGNRRRRRGRALQPPSPGAARHRRRRPGEGRQRRAGDRAHQPARDGRTGRARLDGKTRARSSPAGTSRSTAPTISPPATRSPTPVSTRKPLVTAAIGEFDGTLTTLKPYEGDPDGKPNPTYRCLFPEPPPPGSVPACSEVGVLGALAGVLGSLMALEAIREIVGGFFAGDAAWSAGC